MDPGGEEERRRRVSISRHSIKLSNVWPPGNFSAHHLGCSCLSLVSAPHSSTLLLPVSTKLLATSAKCLCLECLGKEFAGEDYISNGVPTMAIRYNQPTYRISFISANYVEIYNTLYFPFIN